MTQVPEYLLERSRARRAALGLGGDGGDAPAATEDAPASAPAAAASDATPAVAEAPVATAPAPAAPAVPAEPLPLYVTDPGPRSGIPYWMMPVLLLLPLWGIVYLGAFGERSGGNEAPNGAAIYQRSCQSCHGARGEGGVGPKLQAGESKLTFPNEADHVAWVEGGSATKKGQPYGDPARGKVATSGGMPGFAGQLNPEEIRAVVLFERDAL